MKSEDLEIKNVFRERWNKSAQRYDHSPGHGIQSEQEKEAWKSLLSKALGNETLAILDVGCGTGVISLLLSEMGHNVAGIDLSEGMLEKAREKANNFDLSVEFRPGDAENLPFENKSFDAVINRHLLWTLPNPEKAMDEWKRVLKPEGKVIIIDGSWGDYNRLHKQVWRYLVSMPLILITERRNPWHGHYGRDVEKQLPMRHRKRPQADIEILENLGFNVDVRDVAVPRTRTFLEYMKYGYWSKQFLVKGVINRGGDKNVENKN